MENIKEHDKKSNEMKESGPKCEYSNSTNVKASAMHTCSKISTEYSKMSEREDLVTKISRKILLNLKFPAGAFEPSRQAAAVTRLQQVCMASYEFLAAVLNVDKTIVKFSDDEAGSTPFWL